MRHILLMICMSVVLAGCTGDYSFLQNGPDPTPVVAVKKVEPTPGVVLGVTQEIRPTPRPTPTPVPANIYTTSTDLIQASHAVGETKLTPLTLTNNSPEPVMWYIKLKQKQSTTYPISINGTNEVTGTIPTNSATTVQVGTMHTSPNPNFSDTFEVVFQTQQAVVARRIVQVSVQSPMTKYLSANSKSDVTDSVSFIPNGSYGLMIANKHDKTIRWMATVESDGGNVQLGVTNATTSRYTSTYVPLAFTTTERNGLTLAKISITYFDENNTELSKHALMLTVTE